MDVKPSRTIAVVSATLVFLAGLQFTASAQSPSPAGQDPQLVSLTVGETTRVAGSSDSYERVLLAPPGESKMSIGNAWEMSADVAIKLGRLPESERWRVIRRNLLLAQDEQTDLILWTEVVNAFLDQIGTLPLDKETANPAFGLRVAFPGQDTSANAKADVALTFGDDFESILNKKILDVLTGVEGFVKVANDDGTLLSPAKAADVLARLKLRLLDGSGREFSAIPNNQGYYRFPLLPADSEFGTDYTLRADIIEEKPAGEGGSDEEKVSIRLSHPEGQYAPVRRGARTRLNLTVIVTPKNVKPRGAEIPGAPAPVSMLFQKFVGENFLLGAIMQRLPANPGLHLGVVQIDGAGLQPLWSVRFLLGARVLDRSPRFVSRGSMRLVCLTSAGSEGQARTRYVKIMWTGRADAAQLDLQARPTSEFPLGLGVGVVPSVSPALYAVGASYKLFRGMEVFAGAGIRKDHPTAFVYGLTLDIEDILSALFGKVTNPQEQQAAASEATSGPSEQKSVGPTKPTSPPVKTKK
jgi:hypothetical protein